MRTFDPNLPVYQCVPNFSEGRRLAVVAEIAAAMDSVPGAVLIDYSADADHNRCVMTLLGNADAIQTAVLAAARSAIEAIDLRTHSGVHPRLGALDVLPFVPLWNASREQAVTLAHALGRELAACFNLPIYFYEWAAQTERRALPELRGGGFEAFTGRALTDAFTPDAGPNRVHPTAGITVVGARPPLVAYNVNLHTPDVSLARHIARQIRRERETNPNLRGVRALGLFLESRNAAQVSLNLTCPDATPLPAVFDFVRHEALKFSGAELESEIIGAIPLAALDGQSPEAIRWNNFKPTQILETWLPMLAAE